MKEWQRPELTELSISSTEREEITNQFGTWYNDGDGWYLVSQTS